MSSFGFLDDRTKMRSIEIPNTRDSQKVALIRYKTYLVMSSAILWREP